MSLLPQNAESATKMYIFESGQFSDNGIFSWASPFAWGPYGPPVGGDTVHIVPSRPAPFYVRLPDVTMIYNSIVDYSLYPLASLYMSNIGGGELFFDMSIHDSTPPPPLYADTEYIGGSGKATFNQSASLHVVTYNLYLGGHTVPGIGTLRRLHSSSDLCDPDPGLCDTCGP